ncbi:YopX family protein [Niallia taxi]|uniref:YopX family protein n=1 Tax=Niallia taxi TaxID=2499688 RepID=UPI003180BEB8
MREIKFRGYDGMDWIFGSAVQYDKHTNTWYMIENGSPDDDWIVVGEVGQYTGLKDKQGVEIYEGDVLKSHNQNNIVRYEHGSFMVIGLHKDKYERTYNHLKSYLVDLTIPDAEGSKYDGVTIRLEVVGNIHDNTELL